MRIIKILSFIMLFLTSTVAFAADATLEQLNKKVTELEKNQSEHYHNLAEKKSAGLMNKVSENLSIGGLVEVEAGGEDNNQSGDDSSDIALATVELGIDSEVSENVSGHVLLLWEEGEGPVEVDEGTIEIQSSYGAGLIAGKQYIPFGSFDSHFISDPLTLELGETNESTVILTYATDHFEVAVGAFNGDIDKTGDDQVDNLVAALTFNIGENFSLGTSYLSDMSDTDSYIVESTLTSNGAEIITEDIPGVSGFVNLTVGSINFVAEYLGAIEHFDSLDLEQVADGKDERPYTYNIELAYAVSESTEIALKAEGSGDFGDGTDIPEEQYGAAVSFGIAENTSLAFEYMDGRFEEKGLDKNGNPGDRDRQLYTAQLAIEF